MPRVPVGMAAAVTAAADQAVGARVAVDQAVGPLVVALAVLAVVPAVGVALAHPGAGRMAVGPVPRDGEDEHARRLQRCACVCLIRVYLGQVSEREPVRCRQNLAHPACQRRIAGHLR